MPDLDALARRLVGADHARDLLALLGLEDLGDRADRAAGDGPHLPAAQLGGGDRPDRRLRDVEREAEQRPLDLGVVDRRGLGGDAGVAALDHQHGGLGGLAALLLLARAAVRGDLLAQRGRGAGAAVDGEDPVAGLERARGGRARRRLLDPVDGLGLADVADRPVQPHQDHERQEDVDRGAGGDDHQPLPHRLAVIGAVGDLRRDLLHRVHAGDLHEAAERQPADAVLGLAALPAQLRAAEEQREALHAHPDRLGGGEVPELVQDDQRREAGEGQEPAHASASWATSSPAIRRASASAS